MAMRDDIKQREADKFVQSPTRPDGSSVEVTGIVQGSPLSFPPEADAFTRVVAGNTETIEYRQGGISGTIVKSIKIYYQSPPSPDLIGGELL